ncbi:MAG: asparagine synthase (glutamine-hydrolyzing) [Elusimicrobiota bacterium]
MCGIAGFLRLKGPAGGPAETSSILRAMNQTLTHRGPDDEGYLTDDPAYLAMRRLKIIDLATGKQPISNEDGSVSVVFNGEIYNYVELRRELQGKGHCFSTASDTEVLVHLYEEEGELFPRRLRGMFAFALWDRKKRRLLLGRDHFGIKPLFWGIFGGNLLFASEIKAIRLHPAFERRVDPEALDDFLTLLFVPTPKTIYQGLKKLDAGTVLSVEPAREPRLARYWDAAERMREGGLHRLGNLEEIEEKLEAKISECVRLMLRSDVPLGVFLSAGLDSTTTAYFARRHLSDIRTFTLYFDQASYSERREAGEVARQLGTRHTEIPMSLPEDLAGFAWEVLGVFDEPFGDLSALPTYLLCRSARSYISVALTGDGGDELFGGYPTTLATKALAYYRHLPEALRRRRLPALAQLLPTSFERISLDYKIKRFVDVAKDMTELLPAHFAWRSALLGQDRPALYEPAFLDSLGGRSPFDAMACAMGRLEGIVLEDQLMLADLRAYLLDLYLVKSDMTSMAHSLELRPALLDPELAEFAFSIPPKFKIRGFQTKWILRHLMRRRLPQSVLKMPKKGFTPPLALWLTERKFQDFLRDVTNAQPFRELGVLRQGAVENLLREHSAKKFDHSRRLWAILALARFAHKNVEPLSRDQAR